MINHNIHNITEQYVGHDRTSLCGHHRRSQDFFWGGGTRPTPPSLASVVHTFEAVAGSRGSVSAPAVSRVMGGAPERNIT